jgi:hypothetical protein
VVDGHFQTLADKPFCVQWCLALASFITSALILNYTIKQKQKVKKNNNKSFVFS